MLRRLAGGGSRDEAHRNRRPRSRQPRARRPASQRDRRDEAGQVDALTRETGHEVLPVPRPRPRVRDQTRKEGVPQVQRLEQRQRPQVHATHRPSEEEVRRSGIDVALDRDRLRPQHHRHRRAWTPELEDWAWGEFASGALGSTIHADRRCVLDVIETHWPDPAALTIVTQSDSEIVGREIAARCGRR